MDDAKVYGFVEAHAKLSAVSSYDWSKIPPFTFRKRMKDTLENRLLMYEELAASIARHSTGKVIFMRLPPVMESTTDFRGRIKMVRLDCRFMIAEKVKDNDGS